MRSRRRAILFGIAFALLAGAMVYAITRMLAAFGSCWACGW